MSDAFNDLGWPLGNSKILHSNKRIKELEDAIRKHRDQRGDDRCWQDDEELYKILPEGYEVPKREVAVEWAMCKKYLACRRNPKTEYISPQREIERLQRRVEELEKELDI